MDVNQALETQLKNIQARTGKTVDELFAIIQASGRQKHGEIRDFLKSELAMGFGDANTLTHQFLGSREAAPPSSDVLGDIYTGPKEALRPIHDKVMAAIGELGEFEVAPKKTYLSLRRKKQFAMVGPATNTRVEIGLNMKGVPGTDRLLEQPAGGMCQYKVRLADPSEVDAELVGWIKQAFDSAG